MDKKGLKARFVLIFCFLAVFTIICVARLFSLQIINGAEYKEQAENRLVRAYPIKAPRGEIFDRYGRPMVTNRMGYYVQIQDIGNEDSIINKTIYNLIQIFEADGIEYINDFPITGDPYTFDFSRYSDPEKALTDWKKEQKLEDYGTAEAVVDYYMKKYEVSKDFELTDALKVVGVRYTMESKGFSTMAPYTFANNIDMETVQKLKEGAVALNGISVEIEPVREYVNGNMAAHILGRTDIIYKEEYEELKEKGYGMNDVIGKDGLEKVLEKYLKGKDGYKRVEQNKSGSVSQTLNVTQPVTENYAVLTIDSELQRVAEESLAKNIEATRGDKGIDCFSGAAVAVEINTGEVLAMASLPNYDPAEYSKNYTELFNDPKNPLLNRALGGAYTPGSTFKPLTSIAALEEGIITPSTQIADLGVYKFYAPSYQPTCLIWKNTGETHGTINVSEAIGVSCNYFFYDVGRQLGIEKLSSYAKAFGLGQKTGIELAEADGLVASKEFRESRNMEWYPGDTLQAAIGQSDNMFTPAQLASYVSTIINKGTRYSLRLVKEVRSYSTGEVVYKNEPTIISQYGISDETLAAVKDGMRRVTEDGTAKAVFENFEIPVGGKTGTAEVSRGSDTVLFVGFAPYDNPQIAVAVVLEHGASSRYAAQVARDMFEYYLGLSGVSEDVNPVNTVLE